MNDTRISISHEEATIQSLKENPQFAVEYLNAVLEDGNPEEIRLALKRAVILLEQLLSETKAII